MKKSKTFCILPWVHTHLNTEGDVYPCCISWNSERTARAGWLKDSSLEQIFNNDFMKQLRLDMLNEIERPDVCSDCYMREKSGFKSARVGSNGEYSDLEKDTLIENTKEDGYVEPVIKSWDIRFSNLCNLKCRTCGSLFSTTWAKEDDEADYLKLNAIEEDADDPLVKQYKNVEKIYFAGGEPLIMPEHFKTVKELISRGSANHTKLIYNSNLSKLNYNKNNLIDLWSNFKEVVIGASIDAIGKRAEYIRHGVPWKNIENNLNQLMEFRKKCSTFNFYISPTVGVLNINHLPDMHQYLWKNNLIPYIDSIQFNLLLFPKHYDCRILPNDIKEQTAEKILSHERWLHNNDANKRTIEEYKNLRNHLLEDVDIKELENFKKITKEMDSKRKERFDDVFSEYASIRI
jgi:sulfatase maturation enzyme AslB (radical SAM superfamily)